MTDDSYWNAFYAQGHTEQPSGFAQFCLSYFPKSSTIADIGCGNGRDTFFFARHGHNVIAIDRSEQAIRNILRHEHSTIQALCADAASLNGLPLQCVYSRFSLHSMPEETENCLLHWAYEALPNEGLFCIEARSDKGVEGEYVFGTDHYRRLINFHTLQEKLTNLGFGILHSTENKGLAVYNTEDPYVVRFVARKK